MEVRPESPHRVQVRVRVRVTVTVTVGIQASLEEG